jgi:protein-tyrosine phosphatase
VSRGGAVAALHVIPMKSVLFLCTGNYYRSRCAEILFNHAATVQGLPWRADSRGLRLHPENSGPISRHVVKFLEEQGIHLAEPIRFPRKVSESDLEAADLVVAVKETEHRPLLQIEFAGWCETVEYWAIHDLEVWSPSEALPALASRVAELLRSLMV